MSQPIEVYPNTVIRQPESSHSNGSFGPVFIVLAVIAAISAVACLLGRLCNRQHHRVKEAHGHRTKEVINHHHNHPAVNNNNSSSNNSQGHELGPKEWESRAKPSFKIRERGDVEFGFDKRIPSVRNNGGGMVIPPPRDNGGNGNRPEVRFADNV